MAKYDAGYLSPIKNKLGNAVGRRWRGIPVLAVYNGSPANPRSLSQQLNRAKFSALSLLARGMAPMLQAGLGDYCKGKKQFPRAKFMSDNFGAITANTPSSVTIGYADLVVARGGLPQGANSTPQFDSPGQVDITMSNGILQSLSGLAAGDFKCCVGVYAPDVMQCVYKNSVDLAVNGNASVSVDVPAAWIGVKVHVYVWFECATDKYESMGYHKGDCSISHYAGTGNIG